MQSVYPKTTALILLNIVFLGLNLLIFSSKLKPFAQDASTRDATKTELYVNNLDPGIIYEHKRSGSDTLRANHNLDYDPDYRVSDIERTPLVDCRKILSGSEDELTKAEREMSQRPKIPIFEEDYLEWTKDCSNYKKTRGFVTSPTSQEEADYPLAFGIAMYKDVEQTERLLRMIYQPQNLYCIHIDILSSVLIHRTVHHIANCFPNVFVASHLDKIKWGDVSVLLPDMNCMRDLIHYHKGKWKYYINLTGQEMPLRTNYELVRIAKIFNGSNDIAGSKARVEAARVKYTWTHRWSKTYQQTIFYNTFRPKSPPPFNLEFYKGELHGLFSWRMVEYLVESEVAQKYLDWCWDSGHPSEHYWNVLNYNRHLQAPGGYIGDQKLADAYSPEPIIRAKNWISFYDNRQCEGKFVRGICVYGIRDAPWLHTRPELFANKFHLTYHYLAYDCLEERHRNRTKQKTNIDLDEDLYTNLPTVKYSRKDGL